MRWPLILLLFAVVGSIALATAIGVADISSQTALGIIVSRVFGTAGGEWETTYYRCVKRGSVRSYPGFPGSRGAYPVSPHTPVWVCRGLGGAVCCLPACQDRWKGSGSYPPAGRSGGEFFSFGHYSLLMILVGEDLRSIFFLAGRGLYLAGVVARFRCPLFHISVAPPERRDLFIIINFKTCPAARNDT